MTRRKRQPTHADDELLLRAVAIVTRGGSLADIARAAQRDAIDLAADVHAILWADTLAHGEVAA